MKYPEDFINRIMCGDCLEVMKGMPDNCVDTIITDPPYGLFFMGKKWDYNVPSIGIWQECLRVLKPGGTALIFAGSRTQHRMAVNIEDAGFILKDCIMWLYGSGFPKATDISQILDKNECRKQLEKKLNRKPTQEEFKKAWEKFRKILRYTDPTKPDEAGRGGGFGHIQNEAIPITAPKIPEAQLWNGWKSHGLKPSYEPILVCMKPNEGSYANNALKWGVAGLNIDGGRIDYQSEKDKKEGQSARNTTSKGQFATQLKDDKYNRSERNNIKGRYPANVILDEESAKMLDEQSGILKSGVTSNKQTKDSIFGKRYMIAQNGSQGGASRFFKQCKDEGKGRFPANVILDEEAGRMLDEQSGECKTGGRKIKTDCGKSWYKQNVNVKLPQDNGSGASRFFYCAKASKAERNRGCEELPQKDYEKRKDPPKMIWCRKCNHYIDPNRKIKGNCCCEIPEPFYREINFKPSANQHPTVKPLALMKYLCTLTKTPTGGIVLDPFCGSGTTLMACKELKRDYIGIDNIPEYCEIARRRINATPEPLF